MRTGDAIRGSDLLKGGDKFSPASGILARYLGPGFDKIVDRVHENILHGSLVAHLPDRTVRVLGGHGPGFNAELRLHDWRAVLRLYSNGSVGWYRAWEAGEWDSPDPVQVFALVSANAGSLADIARAKGIFRRISKITHWFNRNTHKGSERNIRAHYDLGNDFYREWLDPGMTYSSAIFAKANVAEANEAGTGLEVAQNRKMTRIMERIAPAPDSRLLEIGCGWGSLSAQFAQNFDADIVAISLSDEQLDWARRHYAEYRNLEFRNQDYRDVTEQFDGIYSVEMVEALGKEYWPDFLDCIAHCLKPGGRAALQYISMQDALFEGYQHAPDFIQAYVFPGGMLIWENEFRELAQARGLHWKDHISFGQDYAQTLKIWRANFDNAVSEERLPAGFDERFCQFWRYYLMYCEGGFRGGGINVHQVTLEKR
ncbi:MAG: class I SAM-dependent methyltransferase [Sphingomonadaceae bacterium]